MNIALISNQAFSILNFRRELVEIWVQKGHCVYAFAPDFSSFLEAEVEAIGAIPVCYSLQRSGINPGSDLVTLFDLSLKLSRRKIDICLSYFMKPVIFGTLAAVLARIPRRFALIEGLGYVYSNSASPSVKRALLRYIGALLYRISLRFVTGFFVLNLDDETFFRTRIHANMKRCTRLPGIGIDLEGWTRSPPFLVPVTFSLVARLLREKGVQEFVSAAEIVKRRYPEARFLLLGGIDNNPGGIKESVLQNWVAKGCVTWLGHVNVKEWLRKTSVVVLPSYYREGMPRSLLEGLAMGRPIITTDMPGCRETVVPEVNGFIIPIRNSLAVAEACFEFLENPDLIVSMGLESRLLAEAKFDIVEVNATVNGVLGV